MRERRKRFATIAEVIGTTAKRLKIADRIERYGLWDRWEGIVGSAIASHARPLRWQGRTLVVRAAHPTWVQELTYLTEQLLERIRSEIPECRLDQIRFEVGEVPKAPPSQRSNAPAPERRNLTNHDRDVIAQALTPLHDDEIREAARRAIEKGLTTQRRP